MYATLSVGDLASRTQVPVKTIRYYSDLGLLPQGDRSAGGHRRYGPAALERLQLIRQLRALELPIASITRVVSGEVSLSQLIAAELTAASQGILQLRWKEAALRALDEAADDTERARRLHLLERVQRLPHARADLADAWLRVIPHQVPPRLRDTIVGETAPDPSTSLTPQAVLAYAELHLIAHAPGFGFYWGAWTTRDKASLYTCMLDATKATAEALTRGDDPPAEVVDDVTSLVAKERGVDDTPYFRAALGPELRWAVSHFRRYADPLAACTDTQPNVAQAHCALLNALPGPRAPGSIQRAALAKLHRHLPMPLPDWPT
ncbi:MerR family transcriptional regulator [Streptomyces sp. NPDC017529]|uniref:helix-turn-helix domain-containing protein n=1 Tax=Streptomyces sp. NPDC017529 TaxID=3365000 RepID=UPI0037981044